MKAQLYLIRYLLAAASLLFCVRLSAEERELAGAAKDKVDAVLVLDSSGSMLVTDPLRLREEGAKLFTQFLKPGDRLGIISFAESAKLVQELKDYSSDQSASISTEISTIENNGQYTNILEGITLAQKMLANNARDDANPSIILMSDGKMEPAPGSGNADTLTNQLVETILPDLRKAGVKVYTLSFSDQADQELLREISATTDGINWFTPTADKIHESFADLFLAVKKPQVVPLTKRGFKIDEDVEEATFYINKEESDGEIALIPPDGSHIVNPPTRPDVKWFSGQKFEVVTVTAPPKGDWQITGVASTDGFATVLTKIRLYTEWPSSLNAGDKTLLQARLNEEEKPISLPEMSNVIKYGFEIIPTDKVSEPVVRDLLYDDGTHGDKIERDGIFSAEVDLAQAGEYKLRVLAKAPTFERNQQMPFRVRPALVSIELETGETEAESAHGHGGEEHGAAHHEDTSDGDLLKAILSDEVSNFKRTSLHVYAISEKREKIELPISSSKEEKNVFIAAINSLPEGTYKVYATIAAENKRGQEVKSQSKTLPYHKSKGGIIEPIKIETPKEEPHAPASPLIPIILMTLLNGGAAFLVFKKQKDGAMKPKEEIPTFEPIDSYKQKFSELRARLEVSEIDFSQPLFTDPEYSIPVAFTGQAASIEEPPVEKTGVEVPPPEEAAPQDEVQEAPPSEEEPPPAEEPSEEESA